MATTVLGFQLAVLDVLREDMGRVEKHWVNCCVAELWFWAVVARGDAIRGQL